MKIHAVQFLAVVIVVVIFSAPSTGYLSYVMQFATHSVK